MEIMKILMLLGVGIVAGFVNVMAGGGSAIAMPVLIFMGLDSAIANGTNRVAIFLQNIFAVFSFKKEKFQQFKTSMKLALWTLPGAVLGAFAAVRISDVWFQRILALVMIGIVLSMVFSPTRQQKESALSGSKRLLLIYPALLGIGFYGGFIQAGVGFLFMASLYHILNLDLVFVNMHKVFIIFIYTIPALAIFVWTGNVDWLLGLSLAAGNSFGGWWAAKMAVRGGEKVIRAVLSIAIIIMSVKLLLV
ncbi:MAG: sulfite exporter TauE/SafE family protein [Deltaproteobacteria bacterium]|nr:sulfite exporter TauE/SafE family protein [Deltaproteobacteria bacterium]MBW1935103.1 sulfite exporter TauE/SafE family protein [Deltaproteobacteria bacterium]RLB29494.1 MAG: sulfite exporter TauE/SafE family protein [Deltaproteobacteria bacterium]